MPDETANDRYHGHRDTEQAFEDCKNSLANAAFLANPDKNTALCIAIGASDTAIVAVLALKHKPYSIFLKELHNA